LQSDDLSDSERELLQSDIDDLPESERELLYTIDDCGGGDGGGGGGVVGGGSYYSCWWANHALCGGYSCGCGKGCTRTCYYSCTVCYCSPGSYTPSYGYVRSGTTCPYCPGGWYQPYYGRTSCPYACPAVRHTQPTAAPRVNNGHYLIARASKLIISVASSHRSDLCFFHPGVLLSERLHDLQVVPGGILLSLRLVHELRLPERQVPKFGIAVVLQGLPRRLLLPLRLELVQSVPGRLLLPGQLWVLEVMRERNLLGIE
jgi:hypothetical protein